MAKCEVCAIPPGETVCVTCGAGLEVETVNLAYAVDGTNLMPGMSSIKPMTVQEGVKVEPTPCGNCGRMTISRIQSPDGQVGCLECLKDYILGEPTGIEPRVDTWIALADSIPPINKPILVWCREDLYPNGQIHEHAQAHVVRLNKVGAWEIRGEGIGWVRGKVLFSMRGQCLITHWMRIPEKPQPI
jgi:hypothetical protein